MKNADFVVFLDVDGVLNSRTTVQRTPEGYQGIDDARVELLSNVIRRMGGWRHCFDIGLERDESNTGGLSLSDLKIRKIWDAY